MRASSIAASLLLAACPGWWNLPRLTADDGTSTGPASTGDPATSTGPDAASTGAPTTGALSTGDGSGGATGTSAPAECRADPDCEQAPALFCVAGECRGCAQTDDPDAACLGRDPATPACAPSGACVECTATNTAQCDGFTPHCDPDTSACVSCTAHEHCPDSACNLVSGACMPSENVLWADSAADCMKGTGSADAPFCELSSATAAIENGDPSAGWTLKLTGEFTNFGLTKGMVVAMVPSGPDPATIVGAGDLSFFGVFEATAFFDRLVLRDGYGIFCAGGVVYLDRSVVTANQIGAELNGCAFKARRSVLHGNGRGLSAEGTSVVELINAFVTDNGPGTTGGIELTTDSELRAVFSSVIANFVDDPANVTSLRCDASSSAELRSSIVMASGTDQIACANVDLSYSALTQGATGGDTNVKANPIDIAQWFAPPSAGIYRPFPGAPLATVGRWQAGDPPIDFDGDARVAIPDADEWPGADRP